MLTVQKRNLLGCEAAGDVSIIGSMIYSQANEARVENNSQQTPSQSSGNCATRQGYSLTKPSKGNSNTLEPGDGRVGKGMKTGAHFLTDLGAEAQSLLMTGNRVMGKHQGGEFLKPNALACSPVEINGNVQFSFSVPVSSRGAELSLGAFKSPTPHNCKEQLEK